MIRYIVETLMLHGWDNCWHMDDSLESYATYEAAQAALTEFLRDAKDAGLDYEPEDYRISEVPK